MQQIYFNCSREMVKYKSGQILKLLDSNFLLAENNEDGKRSCKVDTAKCKNGLGWGRNR